MMCVLQVLMRPCQQSILAEEGLSVSRYPVWEGGGDSTRAWTAIWQLSQTLVSDVTMFCSVEVIQKFSCSTKKWNGNVMLRWSTLAAAREQLLMEQLSPESQHVETDHEHQASRTSPSRQVIISNNLSLTIHSWPLAVLEYRIRCYRFVQYRTDKAIDTLKTHREHKHTGCIALNVRFVLFMDEP